MNACTLRVEALETGGVGGARKSLDGSARALSIGVEIQQAAVTPGVARDDRTLQQLQSVIQACTGVGKKLFED